MKRINFHHLIPLRSCIWVYYSKAGAFLSVVSYFVLYQLYWFMGQNQRRQNRSCLRVSGNLKPKIFKCIKNPSNMSFHKRCKKRWNWHETTSFIHQQAQCLDEIQSYLQGEKDLFSGQCTATHCQEDLWSLLTGGSYFLQWYINIYIKRFWKVSFRKTSNILLSCWMLLRNYNLLFCGSRSLLFHGKFTKMITAHINNQQHASYLRTLCYLKPQGFPANRHTRLISHPWPFCPYKP